MLSAAAVAAALGWHSATSAISSSLAISTIKAACAAANGAPVSLPASVIELSEGIIRMFVLNKLKTVAAGAMTCLFLLAGLSVVSDPTLRANPEEKQAIPKSSPPTKTTPRGTAESDDATFLRRVSLDLRGLPPTTLEMHYFLDDRDAKKRTKVVDWMLSERGEQKVTAYCASCHKTGNTAEDVAAFLGMIYKSSDPHSFLRKVDGHGDAHAMFVLQLAGTASNSQEADLALAKIDVERARKVVDAAQAKLLVAEAEAKRLKNDESKAKHDRARFEQAEALAQLKKAEANLTQAESTPRKYYLRLKSITAEKKEDTPSDLNTRIRAAWALLRAPEASSDAEFLRRASLDLRGAVPTIVELNYFAADKDPKKREKLLALLTQKGGTDSPRDRFLNELLADPAVQARWMEIWKQRLEKEQVEKQKQRDLLESWIRKKGDRLDQLLGELLSSKRSDEQILEALCLATVARFPTATEKKVILNGLKTQPDRTAAWNGVLRALASTEEAKSHAEELTKRSVK